MPFDSQDRQLVVEKLQELQETNLTRVGRYRKLLRTGSADYFCIVGATDDWHGISEGMLERIEREANQGFLVLAIKFTDRIEVFRDEIAPLLENPEQLSYSSQGNYQFHSVLTESQACVRELDSYCLPRVATVQL